MKQSIWFYSGILILSIATTMSIMLGYATMQLIGWENDIHEWVNIVLLILSSILFTVTIFLLKHTTFDSDKYSTHAFVICLAICALSIFVGVQNIINFMEAPTSKIIGIIIFLINIPLFLCTINLYKHIVTKNVDIKLTPYYLPSFSIYILLTTILCILQITDMYHPFLNGNDSLPSYIKTFTIVEIILLITPIAKVYINSRDIHVDYNNNARTSGLKKSLLVLGLIQCSACLITSFQYTNRFISESIWPLISLILALYLTVFLILLFSGKLTVRFDKSAPL